MVSRVYIANITQTCHGEECEECPICFDKLNNKNKLTTVCNHKFCVNCVEKMYNKRLVNCPLCRTVNNHTYKERQFPPFLDPPELEIVTDEEVFLHRNNRHLFNISGTNTFLRNNRHLFVGSGLIINGVVL
jgi:hypothetical protein